MARGVGGKSPANLQKFLKGADYPASRDDLYELAENNGAEDDVLDIIRLMPDVDFESPAEVQEAYGDVMDMEELSRSRRRDDDDEDRGRPRKGGRDLEKLVREVEQNRSKQHDEEDTRQARGRRQDDDEDDDRRTQSRRRQDDDEEETRAASRKHVDEDDEDFQMAKRQYEERKQARLAAQKRDDDEWDHRLKGHETRAIKDAREMKHGYDGRGRVTNPEDDHRLKGNETKAIKDAREMKHGYDGRGRVRKFGPGETDETIADDRERYEERQRRIQDETEPDPETGAFSHRRKDDDGKPTDEAPLTAEERHKRQTYAQHKASRRK